MSFQIVPTADGSISCLDSETGQLCHNSAGAYTEAVQNYVLPSGLAEKVLNTGHIRVLDACYGMGYNSWALVNELIQQPVPDVYTGKKPLTISIVAIEKHPEILSFLPQVLAHPTFDALKIKMTPSEHNTYYRTLECFLNTKPGASEGQNASTFVAGDWRIELTLWVDDLRYRVPLLTDDFDAIFHDPFSPQKMPELWTQDLFKRYRELLYIKKGVLLTYSTAAAVRGGLREAGFTVLKTPGLGKKAGGTLALSIATSPEAQPKHTIPLESWELEYLQSRAGIPYRDSGLSQSRAEILHRREQEQAASDRPSGSQALKKKTVYGQS